MSSLFRIERNLFPTSIFPFLGPFDTAQCATVCKYLKTQASKERLWEYFFKKTFGEASKPRTFTYQQEYAFRQTRITSNIARGVFCNVDCEALNAEGGLGYFTISHFHIDWQGRIIFADIEGGRALIFVPPNEGQEAWKRLPIAIGLPNSVQFSKKGELIVRYKDGLQKTFTFIDGKLTIIKDKYECKKEKKENSQALAVSPGGRTIFSGDKNGLEVYRNGKKAYTIPEIEQVRFLHFTEDGRLFVVFEEYGIKVLQFCVSEGASVWEKGAPPKMSAHMTLEEYIRKCLDREPFYEGIKRCPMSLLQIAEEFARLSDKDKTWAKDFLFDHLKVLPLEVQEQILLELLLIEDPNLTREGAKAMVKERANYHYKEKTKCISYYATNKQRSDAIFHFLNRKRSQSTCVIQ
jgi:hypothetical protein